MKENITGMDSCIEVVNDDISYKEIITEKINSLEREVSVCLVMVICHSTVAS